MSQSKLRAFLQPVDNQKAIKRKPIFTGHAPRQAGNRITPPDPQGSDAERPDRRSLRFGKKPEAVAGAPEGLGPLLCLTGFGQERKPEYGMQVFRIAKRRASRGPSFVLTRAVAVADSKPSM